MNKIYQYKLLKLFFIAFLVIGSFKLYAQVPIAKFGANRLKLEVYEGINLTDSSTNTPILWEWSIYDSTTFKKDPYDPVSDENSGYVTFDQGTSKSSKNPKVSFYREGKYTIVLRCANKTGWSTKLIKKDYIIISPYTTYYLGFGTYGPQSENKVETDFGSIYDNGGINSN